MQGTNTIGTQHAPQLVGTWMACALVAEVNATPKPGLVDRLNTGAHQDMDRRMFVESAAALRPYFSAFVWAGMQNRAPFSTCFEGLVEIGLRAEQAMLKVTGGVNTHKGALFSGGLICAAAGLELQAGHPFTAADVCARAAELVSARTQSDLERLRQDAPPQTHGEQAFIRYGAAGVRGEAAAGFPSVQRVALPALRAALTDGLGFEDACLQALLHLMARVEDTNVLHRSDPQTLVWFQEQARDILLQGGLHVPEGRARLVALDTACIERNISPGGCADLLALAIVLNYLETRGNAYGWLGI